MKRDNVLVFDGRRQKKDPRARERGEKTFSVIGFLRLFEKTYTYIYIKKKRRKIHLKRKIM